VEFELFLHEFADVEVLVYDLFVVAVDYLFAHAFEFGVLFLDEGVYCAYFGIDEADVVLVEYLEEVLQSVVHEVDVGF
jgi:hypothetical protein